MSEATTGKKGSGGAKAPKGTPSPVPPDGGRAKEPTIRGSETSRPAAARRARRARDSGPGNGQPGQGCKIRILLADDHGIIRQGLALLLGIQPDLEVVGEAANGEAAIELARASRPDVVIMDIGMPVMNGIEATKAIVSQFPEIHVIGLSMYDEARRAAAMLEAGADAYLSKAGPTEELVSTIRRVAARRGRLPN
jgi:CheY-like chemotaxis protein